MSTAPSVRAPGQSVLAAPAHDDPLLHQALTTWPEGIDEVEPWDKNKRHHSLEDVVRAFALLYMNGGNITRTVTQLEGQPGSVTKPTLLKWRQEMPARYAHVGKVFKDVAEEQIIVALRENTIAAVNASTEAIHLEAERIAEGKVKDPAAAAQRLMTVAGIGIDKMLGMTGRPQNIVQHQSGQEILRALSEFNQVRIDVESTAEPVDAEEVSP